MAETFELKALRKVRLWGEIKAHGKRDWNLTATLGATVVQDCVVSLEPVTTRIDEPVKRLFLADYTVPDDSETEMPEDDSVDPLPEEINLYALLEEALALHIPQYPRLSDATLETSVFTKPGAEPLTDETSRPFAGLSELRDALKAKE